MSGSLSGPAGRAVATTRPGRAAATDSLSDAGTTAMEAAFALRTAGAAIGGWPAEWAGTIEA